MHVPVLLQSTIELLDIEEGETVVDATLGLGGHAKEIARHLGKNGLLIGLDADALLLAKAEQNLADVSCRTIFINTNFRRIKEILSAQGIEKIDAALFDLGLNSEQFENSGRGFSFQKNEPLLMTLSADVNSETLTAYEIINTWAEESLADIIYGYGEERLARKIARAITEARTVSKIETTFDLAAVIGSVMPAWRKRSRIHFATKTFQALRIAVNDEIGALETGLNGVWEKLSHGGRVAALSFHSLESRMIKNFFKVKAESGAGRLITKKAIKPSREEVLRNPRSRSAQLRVMEKI